MLSPLQKPTSSALRELSASLRDGYLAHGSSAHAVQQIVGPELTAEVVQCLQHLLADGWSTVQICEAIQAIIDARESALDPESLFDLVLSGPEVTGVPTRDTSAVMHAMIEDCEREVLLAGYAIHKGRMMFERLAQRMAENPEIRVRFCLNVERRPNDDSLDREIVRRFAGRFATEHWPWNPKPEVFYDPRSLSHENGVRSSLHAKCIIVDRRIALVTSANFTEAAHRRNIEAGVVIGYPPFVERLAQYFDSLCESLLQPCRLEG